MRVARCLAAVTLSIALGACSSSGPRPPATATPAASATPAPPARPVHTGGDWTTYQHDPARNGHAAGPDPRRLGQRWSSPDLDGDVYSQPLIFRKSVIAATEKDTVYSLDVNTGRARWARSLGQPMRQSQLPCGNIDPSGITGTPVIDPAKNTVYVVAFVQPGHHVLSAIDPDDGRVEWSRSVDAPDMDPLVQQQRGALLLDEGRLYVVYGGLFGDCGDYHGWVTSVSENGTGPISSFQVPSERAAGIWSPAGASADGNGHIFVATGNSFSTSTFDYGNSVIELSRDLQKIDYFAPEDWAALNASDVDIGSTAPLLLANGLVFQIGKSGVGYLLDLTALGAVGNGVFHQSVCTGGAYGATAFAAGTIFVGCTDGLYALRLGNDSFKRAWVATESFAGPPVVGSSWVWTITRDGALRAYEVRTGRDVFDASLGGVANFAAPALSDGCVFAASLRHVHAYCVP